MFVYKTIMSAINFLILVMTGRRGRLWKFYTSIRAARKYYWK